MFKEIEDESVVIVKDGQKEIFLKKIRTNTLQNIKVIELNEFKKKYFFDYTNEAIYHVHKKFNVIKNIAKIYIDYLYYIDEKTSIDDTKIELLFKIKDELVKNDLLITSHLFKNYIETHTIIIYDLKNIDTFYLEIFKKLEKTTKVIYLNEDPENFSKKPLFKFSKACDEVAFVASKICELIKKGIDINDIKLTNVKETHYLHLKNIFKDFNIPLCLKNEELLTSSIIINEFKKNYEKDIDNTLEKIKTYIKTDRDQKVYDSIIKVLNDYTWAKDLIEIKDFVFEDIDKIKLPQEKLQNAVLEIDYANYIPNQKDYIFLINFNQGIIPSNKKDEDFLNDSLKSKLNMSTSIDINKKSLEEIKTFIKRCNNLTVTYIDHDAKGELYISNAYDENILTTEIPEISFIHSNAYNKKILLKARDENKKYGTKTKENFILENHYKDEPYLTYDNTFKGINETDLNEFLENKLTLSYSSMNTYFKCSFRYYLEYILHLNKFEDTFEIIVGNIYHEILSVAFKEDSDFEKLFQKSIENKEHAFTNMEKFFLNILKEELALIIDYIRDSYAFTDLNKALYEQKITVIIDEEKNISFKGFIDKILYGEFSNKIIAAIIDYKTGTPDINIEDSPYGIDMQLPIYAYLIKNYEPLKDAEIGGFYLQKILNNIKDTEKKKAFLKLQGYSNSDINILSHVDNSYENSSIIKSLKVSKVGFSKYSKMLTNDEIDKLINIVHSKILEAGTDIKKAKFDINPKEIGGKMNGCTFCTYKDICFMKNADIVKLKKFKKEDFLGDDKDAYVD